MRPDPLPDMDFHAPDDDHLPGPAWLLAAAIIAIFVMGAVILGVVIHVAIQ